jgi:hypothetical protein
MRLSLARKEERIGSPTAKSARRITDIRRLCSKGLSIDLTRGDGD